MYAIIHESGGQRKVLSGETILIDLLDEGKAKPGQSITFGEVLLIGEGDGKSRIGTPLLPAAKVLGEVVEPVVLGEKLVVQKFRTKKAFKKKTGHRQRYTSVKITSITA
jgi:large subunit ribosomal protein L21